MHDDDPLRIQPASAGPAGCEALKASPTPRFSTLSSLTSSELSRFFFCMPFSGGKRSESRLNRPSQYKKCTVGIQEKEHFTCAFLLVGQCWICGAAKSLAGAEPAATLAQACEKRGRKAGDDRKVEAVDEKYHFRGIGEQVITSFIKVHVPGALGGQDYPSDCWLELPLRGNKAKLMVTTSIRVLVNRADSGHDLEIEGDVLAAKRSHDDDTSGGERDRTSGTSASFE